MMLLQEHLGEWTAAARQAVDLFLPAAHGDPTPEQLQLAIKVCALAPGLPRVAELRCARVRQDVHLRARVGVAERGQAHG